MPRLKAAFVLLSLAAAYAPLSVRAQGVSGVPGTITFSQGQANIDGHPFTGTDASRQQLRPGQTLATAAGDADLLLAPGALLRVGNDATMQMIAGDNRRTEVRLERGVANVSVNVVRPDHLLLVDLPNGQTQILSRGLYAFNTAAGNVRVFNGEADVFPGADTASAVKPIVLKEGHELTLNGEEGRPKPASFDRELADTDLLPWVGPKESGAALADPSLRTGTGYSYAGYGAGSYGEFASGGYPYGYGGYPYGFGDLYGPFGFYGYPFFGVGFGFFGGGYYGGYFPYRGPYRGPLRGPVPVRGGSAGLSRGAFAGSGGRSFGGTGFHGGGGRR